MLVLFTKFENVKKNNKRYSQNDGMLVGEDLLVYFVFDEGKDTVNAYLPKGEGWYMNGKIYKGGQYVTVNVPATDEMPYFVRCGSIIPTDEGDTVFTVYPLSEGNFTSTFFTDDGVSFEYKNNKCVNLHFLVQCNSDTVMVSYANKGNMPFKPQIRLCKNDGRELIIQGD